MLKDWALRVYKIPQVADLCITLQDQHNVQVCEVLWSLWLASQGQQPAATALSDYRKLRRGLYQSIERLRGARRLLRLDP